MLRLRDLVGSTTFPRLHCLQIPLLACTENECVDLITRHSQTLKTLVIDDSYIMDAEMREGLWKNVYTRVAGKCPQLQNVLLRGAFTVQTGHGDDDTEPQA